MTWNVLHRVHAENYREPAVTLWPDEAERVEAVARFVLEAILKHECQLVLMQEVSGDVLTAIRAQLPSAMTALSHQVPRMPKLKNRGLTSLTDPSEHVAVIGPATMTMLRGQTAPNDSGKGLVAVQADEGLVAISMHVSWGSKSAGQLQVLQALMNELPGEVVVGGDFNAERTEVLSGLGAQWVVAQLDAASPRTRQNPEGEGADIDHLIARSGTWADVHVLENRGLSDHSPLLATLITTR